MIKWIRTENDALIQVLNPKTYQLLLVVPVLSYRHPHTLSMEVFLNRLQVIKTRGFEFAFEINDFIQESELPQLDELMRMLLSHQPQAIYFNDLAVGMYLNTHKQNVQTVYAPETILTNALEIELYLQHFDRVVIAKELTLEEMLDLARQFPKRLDLFALGYPLMSMSRRPLVQSYLDEMKIDFTSMNHTDLRLYEQKRQEALPILEERRVTSIYSAACLYPKEEYVQLETAFNGLIHDDLFVDAPIFIDLLQALEKGEDNPHSDIATSKAYFYRKTNLTKEVTV
jgi:U32 family peptidase